MVERVHGGLDAAELSRFGIAPADAVDFSVNLNPYGPPRALIAAVQEARFDRYPDPAAGAAREAWAQTLGRDFSEIAVGHGAADLFWAIARGLLAPGQRVVIAEPTFSEFTLAAASVGARVERVFASVETALRLDLARLTEAARGARALYLCSPNNPTGEYLALPALRSFAASLSDTLLVLDQSFIALSDHADDQLARLPTNVIVVRSLTKEFSCPGLRIGLCLAAPALIARIEAVRPTWPVSSPAQAALAACAGEGAFVGESWRRMREDREAVRLLLEERGFRALPSATSFQLVGLAQPAARLRAALLGHGVVVRDCASFGLPEHVRIAALPSAARQRLARALDAIARS